MKRNFINPILFSLIVVFAFSCGDGRFSGYEETSTGLYYKFYKKGNDTALAQEGDIMNLHMVYSLNDSVLFDSREVPQEVELTIGKPQFQGDIFEGLKMLGAGDSAAFLVSADSFFLVTAQAPELPAFVDSGSYLRFDIGVKEVMSRQEKAMMDQKQLEERKKLEPQELNLFLEQNNIDAEAKTEGIYFIRKKAGSGPNPKEGEYVSLHMSVYLVDSTKLFSTHDRGETIEYEYGQKFDTKGLEVGIGMMRKGGGATLVVPSDMGFGAQQRGQQIAPYTTLIYDVEVVDIRSKAEYEAEQAKRREAREAEETRKKNQEMIHLQNYLEEQNITEKPAPSGLIFVRHEEGDGEKAVPGKKVKVHYTGKLIDGTIFDSSVEREQPFEFTLGRGEVIRGWDEGIARMKEGGKATLIIPSSLGYGERGAGNTIPPYSTLVFDVELLEVE